MKLKKKKIGFLHKANKIELRINKVINNDYSRPESFLEFFLETKQNKNTKQYFISF